MAELQDHSVGLSSEGRGCSPQSIPPSAAAVSAATGGTSGANFTPPKKSVPLNAAPIERRRLRKKHAVRRLEKKLENYNRQIKKFSEEEVSLEEMLSGSSAYLKEDYIKRKFMATWDELCSLLKIPSNIEVAYDDKEDTYATPYPEINRRVQRLLKTDEFPDYVDICELVERCNTKHKLGISLAEKTQISEKLFKAVGRIIKCRRSRDYRAHFGSHLTDAMKMEDDPALRDGLLLEQLQKSLEQGKKEMQTVVDDFVVKQEVELERKGGVCPQGDSCNEEEEEEEEGEEVVCHVESDDELSEKESLSEESGAAKRIRLDPDSASSMSSCVGAQEESKDSPTGPPSAGTQEGSNRGSPVIRKTSPPSSAGGLEDSSSSSSSIDVGDATSTAAAAASEIIIPDSDSDVVIISDSD